MVANGDGRKQVAILELGWTTDQVNPDYAWHAVDEAMQADYLVRAYQYAAAHWRPWVGLMTTIYIAEWEWTPEDAVSYTHLRGSGRLLGLETGRHTIEQIDYAHVR